MQHSVASRGTCSITSVIELTQSFVKKINMAGVCFSPRKRRNCKVNCCVFNCNIIAKKNYNIRFYQFSKENASPVMVRNSFGILKKSNKLHGENFMAIFTSLSVVIWFSTGTLGIFATLVYVFTMRVVIYDILSMAIITTLSTSILFCNLCYILL